MSSRSLGGITTGQVATNATTATRLASPQTSQTGRVNWRIELRSMASGSDIIYIGHASTVTSSTGFPLAAGERVKLQADDPSRIWAISSANTPSLAYVYT